MTRLRRVRVRVEGRVQGVFFREATRREALALGVSGWVRNCADGSVQAVFEGDAKAVEQAIDFVRRGPEWARVSRVEVTDEAPTGECLGFEVKR
jgi:acylphosphatase